jgi:nitrite reductase/ring-hydroxylating ferredoxin subunit
MGMAQDQRLICTSAELSEGGTGVRFTITRTGEPEASFVIRAQGQVYAFINCCPHRSIELDWGPGKFFDQEGHYLVCATHGALFEPTTGFCVDGPCEGERLEALTVFERDGQVYVVQSRPEK